MQFIKRHPIFLVFLLAVAGLSYLVYERSQQSPAVQGGFGGGGQGAGAMLVRIEPVRVQTIANVVESIGTASANESIDVTASVSETVRRIHFQDGNFVERGDLLVELTDAAQASRLAEARASYEDARRQLDRLEGLADRNLVARNELDSARTNLEMAQARLNGVLVDLEHRVVRAPFAGQLGFRNISEGSLVTPSTVISTLDDISIIKLDFTIPEVHLSGIRAGDTVRAKSVVYPDRDFAGEVMVIGSRVDPVTRSVSVRAHIENADSVLRPGMLLTVAIALNEHEAIVVPEEAVILRQGRAFVFVVNEERIARQVEVTLGMRQPGIVEILSGLRPDQYIVTQGMDRLRDGAVVRFNNIEFPFDSFSRSDAGKSGEANNTRSSS